MPTARFAVPTPLANPVPIARPDTAAFAAPLVVTVIILFIAVVIVLTALLDPLEIACPKEDIILLAEDDTEEAHDCTSLLISLIAELIVDADTDPPRSNAVLTSTIADVDADPRAAIADVAA